MDSIKKLEQAQQPLYAIAVPGDATEITVKKYFDKYFHVAYDLPPRPGFTRSGGFSLFYKDFGGKSKYPKDVEIVGTATKDDIDFDVYDYVEMHEHSSYNNPLWKNYRNSSYYHSPEPSFRSLLTANGIDFNDEQKLVFIKPV